MVGDEKLLGLRNKEICLSSLHSELDALIWSMENMVQYATCQSLLNGLQECHFNNSKSDNMAKFFNRIGGDNISSRKISRFQDHSNTKRAKPDDIHFSQV